MAKPPKIYQMKPVRLIQVILLCIFFLSCQKEFSDTNVTPPDVFNIDASKFIDTVGITDNVQRLALNGLVTQLKDSSLWNKFLAIYPMIGGTSLSMSYNLLDPRNSDDAYRLTFKGTPVFNTTGILFPTTTDYADTHLIDSVLVYNNSAISYFSLTQNAVDGYDMGCVDNAPPYNEFAIYHSTNATDWFGYFAYGIMPANTKGLFVISCTGNDVKRYDNSVVTSSKGSAPKHLYTNFPILIGAVAGAASVGQRECGFASIGYGLTDAQVATFNNIVQNYEAALGR
jgi:hypothetical protein